MNENEIFAKMYEDYKLKREAENMPIQGANEYIESMQLELATIFRTERPKKEQVLTPEQQAQISAYYNAVCSLDRQKIQTSRRIIPKAPVMELKAAKKGLWEIMQEELKDRSITFVFDDHNKLVLDNLVKYFIYDSSSNYRLNKGIFLFGDVGRGKTFLLTSLQVFCCAYGLDSGFSTIDMKHIARDVQKNGTGSVEIYTQGNKMYDDVGFEERALHFGNNICVFTELINMCYRKFTSTGKLCHVTSNLSPDANIGLGTIHEKYGARVDSRCKEMFNFVYLGGNDKRSFL